MNNKAEQTKQVDSEELTQMRLRSLEDEINSLYKRNSELDDCIRLLCDHLGIIIRRGSYVVETGNKSKVQNPPPNKDAPLGGIKYE